jgi:hypothetical protein
MYVERPGEESRCAKEEVPSVSSESHERERVSASGKPDRALMAHAGGTSLVDLAFEPTQEWEEG